MTKPFRKKGKRYTCNKVKGNLTQFLKNWTKPDYSINQTIDGSINETIEWTLNQSTQ